jgi:ribosome recycling factor
MDTLKRFEKDGHHSLDDTRRQTDELQKLTDATIKEIDELLASKEREIMQV